MQAQKFGVVKGSYQTTPLPRLKTFQASHTPGPDASHAAMGYWATGSFHDATFGSSIKHLTDWQSEIT